MEILIVSLSTKCRIRYGRIGSLRERFQMNLESQVEVHEALVNSDAVVAGVSKPWSLRFLGFAAFVMVKES